MTLAQTAALAEPFDFHLWLNDDVMLRPDALAEMLALHDRSPAVIVGATLDPVSGQPSYGGYRHHGGRHPFRFQRIFASGGGLQPCDSFNGNCVLIPASALALLGPNDPAFHGVQPLGDIDYGLRAKAAGIAILVSLLPVGDCQANHRTRPWRDPTRSLAKRLKSLTGPWGPANRQTMFFYRRHGGKGWRLWLAIHLGKSLMEALRPVSSPADRALRLALVEPVMTWYRRPWVALLARRDDLDLTLFHGTAHLQGAPAVPPPDHVRHHAGLSVYWPFGGDRILWCAHLWRLLSSSPEVVIMPEHVYTLSNWVIWLRRQLTGHPRLVLTGQFQLDRKPAGWLNWLRRQWLKGADVIAPYTDSGAHHCRTIGIPTIRILVQNNTLDVTEIRRVAAELPPAEIEAERVRLGLTGHAVFLFIGRLYPAKQSPLAAQAVWDLARSGIPATLLVIGEGEDAPILRKMNAEGAPLRLLGSETDPHRLARWFALAQAMIAPDAAGLSVVHSFAHALPLVVAPSQRHNVEIDYLRHDDNGLMADEMTAPALTDQLRRLIDQPELLARLRQGARRTADGLTLEAYAEHMAEAARRAKDLP